LGKKSAFELHSNIFWSKIAERILEMPEALANQRNFLPVETHKMGMHKICGDRIGGQG